MSKPSNKTDPLRFFKPKANAGCLYWLFIYPFQFIFGAYYLLFGLIFLLLKGAWALLSIIASPLRGKKLNVNLAGKALALPVIPLIIAFCCLSLVGMAIVDSGLRSVGILPTYTPSPTVTLTPSVTPTALPPTKTKTPLATHTLPPSPTKIATLTLSPTLTETLIPSRTPTIAPTQPEHPYGTTGRCKDGTYTSAQHKQGACSHHGGVAEWWGP